MAEFISNPRRAPRAPARCRAAVATTAGSFEAETEDIGTMGCQVVSPRAVRKGELVKLHVTNEKVKEPLRVAGRVAWVSPQAPFRVGIAFEAATFESCTRWFDALIAAYPGLAGHHRVPDRIPTDATVYLGPPPKFLFDFSSDEALLLRAIASGARVDELMVRLRDRWAAAQRALFSLIARQVVTFQRGQAVHPASWKKILTDVEASLAIEEMGKGGGAAPLFIPLGPTEASPAPRPATGTDRDRGPRGGEAAWQAAEPLNPSRMFELEPPSAPLEIEPTAVGPADPGFHRPASTPAADFTGAGVGWRKAQARSPEAQGVFDRALAELKAGSTTRAIALLRRALALAPGDPDIAAALGRLAFKDRKLDPG